jgi:hypothetical protein
LFRGVGAGIEVKIENVKLKIGFGVNGKGVPGIPGDPEATFYIFVETDALHFIPPVIRARLNDLLMEAIDGQREAILAGVESTDHQAMIKALNDIEVWAGPQANLPNGWWAAIEGKCFPGDTPILMADGATKPIHAVDTGDWIMALDPAQPFAGLVPRQVVRLYRNTTDTWLKLTFLDGGTLSATPGHEMLAADGRFARLDQLVSWQADGTGRVTLVGESGELRPARAKTIRFSAATAHLYPLADAAALAHRHQIAPHTFGNLALPPVLHLGEKTCTVQRDKAL